jgi:hypothetical protein
LTSEHNEISRRATDVVFLARLDENIEKAGRLISEQRTRLAAYQDECHIPRHASELLENMVRSLELLHLQRALLTRTAVEVLPFAAFGTATVSGAHSLA